MKNQKSILGLVTARGGSRGIPKKNIVPINGKPLIAWTIEAALRANTIDRCIVSTDSMEIADVCRRYGAEVPFMRPAELAGDHSDHMQVVVHALEWVLKEDGECPEWVVLLQPTSPLRSGEDIDAAFELAIKHDADSIIGVTELDLHPYFARKISAEGTLENFMRTPSGYLPRQKLPSAYHENGAIYLGRRDILLKNRSWYTKRTYPYIMPPERSLDINTPWDLYLASLIIRHPYVAENESINLNLVYNSSTQ